MGPTLYAPLAGKVDLDSKAWGQSVKFSKNKVNFSLGFMQNKAGFVQMPVLIGYRKHLVKSLHVGLDGGVGGAGFGGGHEPGRVSLALAPVN